MCTFNLVKPTCAFNCWRLCTLILDLFLQVLIFSFLNGTFNEEIYMFQLEGFAYLDHPKKICKFFKTIYGLRQSSRMWYERFNSYIMQTRFTKCIVDPNIYIKCVSIHFVLLLWMIQYLQMMMNKFYKASKASFLMHLKWLILALLNFVFGFE